MGIFESHAHYDDEAFNEDRRELLKELPEKGIEYVVNVGASMESTKSSIALADEYDYIYAAVGVHPNETAPWQCQAVLRRVLQPAPYWRYTHSFPLKEQTLQRSMPD